MYKRNINDKTGYLRLSSPFQSNGEPDEEYGILVARFLTDEPPATFSGRYEKLLKKDKFRRFFNAYEVSLNKVATKPIVLRNISKDRHLGIATGHFLSNRDLIIHFVTQRSRFENSLLLGRYGEAKSAVDSIHARLGESLWWARSSILLFSLRGDKQGLDDFCEDVKSRVESTLISSFIKNIQLICDSDDALLILNSVVKKNSTEFKEAGYEAWALLYELYFAPYPLTTEDDFTESIRLLQLFCLVDQYDLTGRICLHASARRLTASGELHQLDLGRHTKNLYGVASDPLFLRLHQGAQEIPEAKHSKLGSELIRLYNDGFYEDAVHKFATEAENLESPLAYLNIIAKCFSHENKSRQHKLKGILSSIIENLYVVYSLGSGQKHAINSIASLAVRLNGLSVVHHIQASLYIALPHFYPRNSAKDAAVLCLFAHGENTPIVDRLSEIRFFTDARATPCPGGDTPSYRILKNDICQKIEAQQEAEDLPLLLERLAGQSPIKRDYLDTYSSYCLNFGHWEPLVNACASNLVEDKERINCFPMGWITRQIEENKLISIDSIAVLFLNFKSSARQNEYLLMETFEEYLALMGAERPSQILISKKSLSPLELFFFKEVCVSEIMDFLGCFNSLNDLRSERLIILDLLLELGAIDATTRTKEVEELIEQVLIDAKTSELHGAKIYVDEQSIKKKITESIQTYLSLYRLAEEVDDDRVTLITDDSQSNTKQVYLSGSKNSIVLRIITEIKDEFLFDSRNGLDKNLSAEIRHGFFSNLMRSKLEAKHLLTEINEEGKYGSNLVWKEFYSLLSDDIWAGVDGALANFSEKFNLLIQQAEEWMKIRSSPSESLRLFDFELPLMHFQSIKGAADSGAEAGDVIDHIFQLLWKTSEEAMSVMRDKLNVDFKNGVDGLFEQLFEEIAKVKRGAALVDLISAINLAKDEIKEDIAAAAEWFHRSTQVSSQPVSLPLAIEIATNAFRNIKSPNVLFTSLCGEDTRGVRIEGAVVKYLILALINLFDNACRHSGYGASTQISVSCCRKMDGVEIVVSNPLVPRQEELLFLGGLDRIQERLQAPPKSLLLRTEGGSGLTKVKSNMSNVGSNIDIDVAVNGSVFSVRIYYAP